MLHFMFTITMFTVVLRGARVVLLSRFLFFRNIVTSHFVLQPASRTSLSVRCRSTWGMCSSQLDGQKSNEPPAPVRRSFLFGRIPTSKGRISVSGIATHRAGERGTTHTWKGFLQREAKGLLRFIHKNGPGPAALRRGSSECTCKKNNRKHLAILVARAYLTHGCKQVGNR